VSEPVAPAVPPSSPGDAGRSRPARSRRGFGLATAGVAAATVGALALSGTFGGGGANSGNPGGSATPGRIDSTGFALAGFDTCEPLLEYYRSHGAQLVGPYGFDNPWLAMETVGGGAVSAAGAPATAPNATRDMAAADKGSTGTTSYTSDTGTTVQVAGVDELDVAKRHGDLLVTVAGNDLGTLTVLRTGRGHPTVVSRLKLGTSGVQGLVLDGTTALVVGGATSRTGVSSAVNQEGFPGTELVQVDFSDPTRPRVVHTMTLDGSVSGVRLVDGVVRVVLNSGPHDLPFVTPKLPQPPGSMTGGGADPGGVAVGPAGDPIPVPDAGAGGKAMPTPPNQAQQHAYQQAYEKALADATAANQKVVREAELLRFLPTFRMRTPGAPDAAGILTGCSDVSAPQRFSGLDTLTLATFDLRAKGLAEQSSASVIATGSTLYATAAHTYLATSEYAWRGGPVPMAADGVTKSFARLPVTAATTQLHLFDTTGHSAPAYLGSGQVKGHLLNQFAMDEYQGVLRVATTVQPNGSGSVSSDAIVATPQPEQSTMMTTQSQVATLKLVGDSLLQQGVISGLGKGEQIRGVRFDGPLGYVVTFRQTDPLFTIDLRSPAHPTLAGELKMLGYSAYLQPVGPGLLLGVGQDADSDGRQRGLQLSLFDVTNPAAPRRVSQLRLPNTNSSAEYDYHAITVADGLVLLPTTSMGGPLSMGDPTLMAPTVEVAPAPETAKPTAPDAVPGSVPGSGGSTSGGSAGSSDGSSGSSPGSAGTAGMPAMPPTTVLAVPLTGRRFGTPHTLVVPGTDQGGTTRTFVDAHDIWTLTNDTLADHDRTTWRRVAAVRF
jgi:hypothetical protein